jgi:hypothetical protein
MERVKGIEPSCAVWKTAVLPLNYTRVRANDSAGAGVVNAVASDLFRLSAQSSRLNGVQKSQRLVTSSPTSNCTCSRFLIKNYIWVMLAQLVVPCETYCTLFCDQLKKRATFLALVNRAVPINGTPEFFKFGRRNRKSLASFARHTKWSNR